MPMNLCTCKGPVVSAQNPPDVLGHCQFKLCIVKIYVEPHVVGSGLRGESIFLSRNAL